MTYFYGQLFAVDAEIGAMFPAAMDVRRQRFFRPLTHIVPGQDGPKAMRVDPEELGREHRN